MKSYKRAHALQIIYDYLVLQHLDRAEVTVRDIVNFHQLPREHSYTLAATMRSVHDSKRAMGGFRVTGVRGSRKKGYRFMYTIKLVKEIVG